MEQHFEVVIVELVTIVLVLIGQIHDKFHTGLRVDGNRRFCRAVGGGILRREHHLVHDLVVVRVLGHDGLIRPREGALHFVVVGVGGRALYLHILQAGTVGDEAHRRIVQRIDQRVLGRGSDGHLILGDMQGHAGFGYTGYGSVILGEGEADTRRKDVIRVALQGVAILLHRDGELAAHIGCAGLIALQSRLDVGQEGLHIQVGQVVAEIARGFLDQVGQGIPRRREDARHGSGQLPGGGVAAIADGAGGNRDGFRRLGQIRSRPAGEFIAGAGGVGQGDGIALDGVGFGILLGHAAAAQRVADGVRLGRPQGSQGHLARGTGRQPGIEGIIDLHGRRAFPAREIVALAGGAGEVDLFILDGVGFRVGGVVHAAAQVVGDGVVLNLPARIQRHAAFHQVGGQVDAVSLQAGGRAVPAGEVVAGAHRGRGRILFNQFPDIFIGQVVLSVRTVVHHEVQFSQLIPPGVEGYAAGQHIAGELLQHFAGEVGRGIPAAEVVALGRGDHHIHHGFVHPAGGEGVPLHFIGVVGEEVGVPFRGIVGCNGLLPAEVHSDVHVPVSVDGRVLADRLAEVEGIARAIRIVIPARKGQTADRGILRLDKAAVLRRLHHAVEAHVVVVVQAVHLVVRHAAQLDGHIMVRHHEGDGIVLEVRDVAQALGVGGKAQVVVALQQAGRDDDHIAGVDGVQVRGIGGQQRPFTQAGSVDGDGQRPGRAGQRHGDLILRLAAGHSQAGFNIGAAAAVHENRVHAVIPKGRAIHGDGPAVFLALHGRKGHIFRGSADDELGIIGDAGHIQDVGHLAGIAVDSHLHIGGGAGIAVQVGRRKDDLIVKFAHFTQAGGGILPINLAVHNSAAGGGGLQVERNAVQQAAVIGGVCQIAGDAGDSAGDGDARAGLRIDDGVQRCVGDAFQLAGLEAGQGQGRVAGGQLRLGQHCAGEAEGYTVNAVAGVHVDCIEAAVGIVQRLSRILDGRGHIDGHLHTDLGIDGKQQFRGAVMLGIFGREDNLVDFASVVRGQGNDGIVRPVDFSLHRLATAGCGAAGQRHVLQARAVGNVEAAVGIEHTRGDSHGILFYPQIDILASGDGRSVITIKGHGNLDGAGIARAVFNDLARLLGRYGEHIGIDAAGRIRGDLIHGKGLYILNAGKVVYAHHMNIGNGVQRCLHDVIGGNLGRPVGFVAAVADGASGYHHVHGRFGQLRAGPAMEHMAAGHGVAQRDVLAQVGVCGGNGLSQLAADDVAADGIDGEFPCRSQGDLTGGAGGDAGNTIGNLGARRRPSKERIAPAGGLGKDDFAAFNIVEAGIGGVVFAAVELVGDHIVHGLPSRVQRHAAFGHIRIHVDIAVHGRFLRTEPAEELVVLALGRLRDRHQRLIHILRSDFVGLGLLAVVQFVGQNGDFPPAGVEGHAAGQDIFFGVHRLTREVGSEIPAEEIMIFVTGEDVFQRSFTQLMGGVGKAGEFALIAGEDRLGIHNGDGFAVNFHMPAVRHIDSRPLRAAKVHGDVRPPIGIQGHIAFHLPGEVVGFALAGSIVIPARKGQSLNGRIVGPGDGFILQHVDAEVGAKLGVVVHEVRLVAAHAVKGNLDIVERHDKGHGILVHGVLQARGLGGQAQALVALLQLGGNHHPVAGGDGGHVRTGMAPDGPAVNALRIVDGEVLGQPFQGQDDLGFRLASGHSQTCFNVLAAVDAQHDRALIPVEINAVRGQDPAVCFTLHGQEGHHFRRVAAAKGEHGVPGRFGRINDIGDITGIAGEAVGKQPEGQVVFLAGFKCVKAHGAAFRRHVAQAADSGNAVLHGAVNLVAGGIEPGQGRIGKFGIPLLHRGNHRVKVDFTGAAGLHGAAQNVGVLEGVCEHGGVVPFSRFDAPGVGAPVVQGNVHVDGGGGHLELTGEGEHLPVVLDQLGLVLVFIGQHHVAGIVRDLVGGGSHFVRIDHAVPLAVFAIADDHNVDARIIRRNRLAVDHNVFQRQLRGNVALLQVFKQQLVFGAGRGEHVVGFHGQIGEGENRLAIGIDHVPLPYLIQLSRLHHAHGHAAGPCVQRPFAFPERPALFDGNDENLHLEDQLDFNRYADLQVDGACHIASACRQGIDVHEHARQFDIGINRAYDGYRHIIQNSQIQGNGDADTHAQLADQVDLGGHLAGQLLLVGTALELQEVVVEADLLAVFRRHRDAEGSHDSRLAHQFDIDADGDDTVEGIHELQQGHAEQILILQISIDQFLHGIHQRVGRFLVIVALHGCAVGLDDVFQRGLCRTKDIIHAVAGGNRDLQAHRSLGLEQNGHVHPQESAVQVDVQGQLFLEVQIGCDRNQQTLRAVQGHGNTHTDAHRGGAVLDGQLDIQLGIGHIRYYPRQGIGTGSILIIQHALGVLTGHDGDQHLGLQFVVGSQLAGDGLLDLRDLIVRQPFLQVHLLGGVHIHFGNVVLRIRIEEGHLGGAVGKALHRLDFREKRITRQVSALPGIDRGFIPVDFAVVEHNHLLRLEIHLAGHDQLARDHIALGVMILHYAVFRAVLVIGDVVFLVRFAHRRIARHLIPQHIGQALGELDNLDLLAEHAYRQGVDIFRISGVLHAVFHIQGKGAAGGEARLAVNFRAIIGFAHGNFGRLHAGADLHGDMAKRLGCGHTLGQRQGDGCRAVGKLKLGHSAGVNLFLLLIGGIHGIEGHALIYGIGVSEGRGAFLIHAPAAEGITLLGGIQVFHGLGQQILSLGKHHGLQFAPAEGFKGDDRRFGFVHEAGIQRHFPVHAAQTGYRLGICSVFIPRGKVLALKGGDGFGVIHKSAGRNGLGFHGRAFGNEGNQPLVQHKIDLLARLQFHCLCIGAGHLDGLFRFIDDRAGGADGQLADSFLHANYAQRAAALNQHLVGALDNHLGQLRAGIHMEVNQVCFLTVLCFILHRGVVDVHTGKFALAQIHTAGRVQGNSVALDGGQGQIPGRSHSKTLRQHRGHRQVVTHDDKIAHINLAPVHINDGLGIQHRRESRRHQAHIIVGRDGRRRINLRELLRQIAILGQDGQINAVILKVQVCNALRIRGQINIGRVLDNKAQHSCNLLAGLRPGDFLFKGKHIAG